MLIRATQLKPCTIELPLSKSVVNRTIVLSRLYGTPETYRRLKEKLSREELSDDIRVMLRLADELDRLTDFYVEASGTAMRFGTALMAVTPGTRTITGTPRLCQRPIAPLVDALRQLGADIQYLGEEGFPPLCITGNPYMQGGPLAIRGDISSQFISALLMVAPTFQNELQLHIEGELVSKPYIEMTERMVQGFSLDGDGGGLERDWSAAAFWYEISLLSGIRFDLGELTTRSVQGDRVCDEIFRLISEYIGENTTSDGTIRSDIQPFRYDFTECPDLAQAVVVTCAMKRIPFHFTGLQTLRIKETDRITALQIELAKLGIHVDVTDREIMSPSISSQESSQVKTFRPGGSQPISTYNDHRMAMAFAPCAIVLGEIEINDPEVVSKSYPTFWFDLKKAGFQL